MSPSLVSEKRDGWVACALIASGILVLALGVFGPLVILIGALTAFLSDRWRTSVRAALVISGVVILIALWGVEGQLREVQPGNTSILPNRYLESVLMLLIPVWCLTLVA
jgi:hypothetical protein